MARQEGGECSIGSVRARLSWLAGAVGVAGAVLYRRLGRSPAAEEDPRAAELRQRLDESRGLVTAREEFESAETTVDRAAPGAPPDVEDRRRSVHERGREAAERMRGRPAE
jgi:hypothetical protein